MSRVFESVDPVMAEILRSKTPRERLAIADGMWCAARDMLRRLLRAEHPDWSETQLDRVVAQRLSHEAE